MLAKTKFNSLIRSQINFFFEIAGLNETLHQILGTFRIF